MKPFTVRPYLPGDDQRILKLFNEVFSEDDPGFQPRSLESWRWEFRDNPAGTTIMLGVTDDGEIIAQYACLPATSDVGDERVHSIQGIDSVVHKDYRRGLKKEGPFIATAKAFFDYWGVGERTCFGWGFPNSKAFRIGVKILGYHPVQPKVPVVYRNFFQHENDQDLKLEAAESGASVIEVDRFDERADRLWDSLRDQNQVAVRRDATYLNWRFADCPMASYRLWVLLDASGDFRSLAVTREGFQGHPILGVNEWVVDEKDEAASATMLKHFVELARERQQQRLEMWLSPKSARWDLLLSQGLEHEPGLYNLCMMVYRDDLDLNWVSENFRYSFGDLDLF